MLEGSTTVAVLPLSLESLGVGMWAMCNPSQAPEVIGRHGEGLQGQDGRTEDAWKMTPEYVCQVSGWLATLTAEAVALTRVVPVKPWEMAPVLQVYCTRGYSC